MPESFNPYHKWLGLNADIVAPNHFQLLKVRPIKDEREFQRALRAGVERCLELLARVPPNAHPALQRKLRDQIDNANQILSDPKSRRRYLKSIAAQKTDSAEELRSNEHQSDLNPTRKPQSKPSDLQRAQGPAELAPERRSRPNSNELLPPGAKSKPKPTVRDEGTGIVPPAEKIDAMQPLGRNQDSPSNVANPSPAVPANAPTELPQAMPVSPTDRSIPIAAPVSSDAPVAHAIPVQASTNEDSPSDLHDSDIPATPVIDTNAPRRRKLSRVIAERLMQLFIIVTLLGGGYLIYANFDTVKRLVEGPKAPPASTSSTTPPAQSASDRPATKENNTSSEAKRKPTEATEPNTNTSTEAPANSPAPSNPEKKPDVKPPAAPKSDPKTEPEPHRPIKSISAWHFQQNNNGILRQLRQRNFTGAQERLAFLKEAIDETNDPVQSNRVESVEVLMNQVQLFFKRLQDAPQTIVGNRQIQIGEQILGFVEADDTGVLLRNAGSNIRYEYRHIPPGLIIPLIETADIDNVYRWAFEKAAFYALNRKSESEFENKINSLMEKANSGGIDIEPLKRFLDGQFERPTNKLVLTIDENDLLEWVASTAKRVPSKAEQAKSASLYQQQWKQLVATNDSPALTTEAQTDLIKAMILDSIRSGDAHLVQDAFAILTDLVPFDVSNGHFNALQRQVRMSTKNSLNAQQHRTLVEEGIRWIKFHPEPSSTKKRREMTKEIATIASKHKMLDALRRLDQLNSK